jgi:hypothetical protein
MDALNKNFPVAQPDIYNNYEWMEIRSGNGINSTGDVEINEGDLYLNGGNILNAQVEGLSEPTNFWSITTPLEMSLLNNAVINLGFNPARYDWSQMSPEPDPITTIPYASVNDKSSFFINEPGLYQIDLGLSTLQNNVIQERGIVVFIHDGTDYLTGTERARVVIQSTDVYSLVQRSSTAYLKVESPTPKLFGITWFNDYGPAPSTTINLLGGPLGQNGRRYTYIHVKKISDDVQTSEPVP